MSLLLVRLLLDVTSPAAELPPLPCSLTAQAPAIDGDLGDACWTKATLATDFSVLGSGGSEYAVRQTTVRAAWDDRALYLFAICVEPEPESVTAKVTKRDGSVWLEDALEVFLQPQPPAGSYFHFVLNARGVYYDARGDDPALNAELDVAARDHASSWRLEIAIPWRELGVERPDAGDQWGFNVGREHRPVEPSEWSTWAPLKPEAKDFHVPELFGCLRFAKDEPGGGRVSLLDQPNALVTNPMLNLLTAEGGLSGWGARERTIVYELAEGSGQYAVRNDGDYSVISQAIDVPVKPGDVFTVFAVIKGSPETRAGIAVVQEMEDGRPDDLYPFWSIPVTEKWQAYSGRIVVDPGATRLKSVVAYRANKAGTVEYAYLQVLPGLHGVGDIAEMAKSVPDDRRPIGDPWVTPHVPCYRPLPKRPKLLVFIGDFQRDVVELAQRLDMEYDFVFCPAVRGGSVENVYAWEADRVYRELAGGEYDAIVLAGCPSAESLVDTIAGAVEAGMGLVLVKPITNDKPLYPESYARLEELGSANDDRERAAERLTRDLPLDALVTADGERPAVNEVTVGRHGKGRVVRIVWGARTPGLVGGSEGGFQSHEYLWALLARATLWAAGQEPTEVSLSVRDGAAELIAHVGGGGRHRIIAEVDAEVGGCLLLPETTAEADTEGLLRARIPLPADLRLRRGMQIVRVRLIDEAGHAVAFAATALPTSPVATIEELSVPGEAAPEATVPVSASIAGEPGNYDVALRLEDAYGRVLDEAERPVHVPANVSAELRVHGAVAVYHRIIASLYRDGVLLDERVADLCVPARGQEAAEDFHLAAGYAAMSLQVPPRLATEAVRFLRANGISAGTVDPAYVRNGFFGWGGTAGGGMGYRGSSHVRDRCFSDPANVAALARETAERVGERRKWGWIGYNMTDEVHLHQDTSVEVCTSEFCTAAFREWAREQYGTIEAVNGEWSTNYASLDTIEPALLEQFQPGDNPARWVDFRLCMEGVWVNAYAAAREAVREQYPEVRMSFTNPYRFDSLSGVDFHRWAPYEDILLKYMHPHVLDRYRSWSDAPMVSWFGYRSSATEASRFLWWFALQGGAMPIWWDALDPWAYHGQENYTSWNMLDPLWRRTRMSESVQGAAGELSGGLYRLASVQEGPTPEVGVLHSQPSMHVLYFEAAVKAGKPVRDGYSGWERAHAVFTEALRRRGIPFRYVVPAEIEAGALDDLELLVLPRSVALSDETCGLIAAFVESRGKLLADVMPATHTAHGRPRAEPALAAIFAGEQAVLLGDLSGTEDRAERVDAALSRMAPEPAIRISGPGGDSPPDVQAIVRGDVVALVRDASAAAAKASPVRVTLANRRHVYDCRAGKYLGERKQFRTALLPGEAGIYVVFPYRVTDLDAEARLDRERQAMDVSAKLRATSQPGTHVLHVVAGPSRQEALPCYRTNVVAEGGRARVSVPVGLNEDPSEWKVWVKDVATGIETAAQVEQARP